MKLAVRSIPLSFDLGRETVVPDVRNDPNDAYPRRLVGAAHPDAVSKSTLAWPVPIREGLVDDNDGLAVGAIRQPERATLDERDPHHFKIARGRDLPIGRRALVLRRLVAFDPSSPIADLRCKRQHANCARVLYAGKRRTPSRLKFPGRKDKNLNRFK